MAEQMKQDTAGKAIPAGYKQTEVGIIPEDWDLHEFGSLVNYKKGYAFKSTDYQGKVRTIP